MRLGATSWLIDDDFSSAQQAGLASPGAVAAY